ncbi:MAG TPA: malto-oligosyltrehalose trehalohydrolase [Steroidobacteraceae bacterium]|nr:malto-oligosyltrehalose trehalohydrolase [Steroidobacteraceae bacterium]
MMFSLWAPRARRVELVTGEERIALERAAEGHWQVELAHERVRSGYRFSLDGGPPLPDPRSRWQPSGVHGPSQIIDPAPLRRYQRPGFRAAPLRDAVIYELHIGTYTPEGTYAAAEQRLAHLLELGVTHLELMPVATFPGRRGWGYDGVDLCAPLPAYGTPEELAHFIDCCHEKGLGVLLDVVYNHLGPDGNYLASYGPYFTDRYRTPWGEAINYDGAQSDEVRRFIIDNALMWLNDYGFDGLRLDAVHAIFCFEESLHILEQLALEVRELGTKLDREFVLIAESDLNDPRLVQSPARGGFGLQAHWADDFHHALHGFFTGERTGYYADFQGLADIATALKEGYVYQGQYSAFRQRRHGRVPKGVAPDQLVVFSQNHDQIGNRARGERLSMLLEVPQLKAIAALTLLAPFVPLLFQGEEWGAGTPFLYFTDHQDPDLGRRVAQGRAAEFASFSWAGEVPDPQSEDTFARSRLDWSELARAPHAELLDWYQRLIRLRRTKSDRYGRGRAKVQHDAARRWLRLQHGGLLASFNLAERPQRIALPAGSWELALASTPGDTGSEEQTPAHGTRIYKRPATDTALPASPETIQ